MELLEQDIKETISDFTNGFKSSANANGFSASFTKDSSGSYYDIQTVNYVYFIQTKDYVYFGNPPHTLTYRIRIYGNFMTDTVFTVNLDSITWSEFDKSEKANYATTEIFKFNRSQLHEFGVLSGVTYLPLLIGILSKSQSQTITVTPNQNHLTN